MKKLFLLAAVMLSTGIQLNAYAAFSPKQNDTGMNALTKQEIAQGWMLLFDGKTMNGWRTYQNKPQTSWYVSKGVLGCKYDTSHAYQHADLITDKQYGNFELALDWKIESRANSGILYMVNERYEYPYYSGPEYQLLDDNFYLTDPKEHIHASQKSGANYDMDAPAADALKPTGEWNHTVIKVNNGHVEHWLNGQKTAEYEIGSASWKEHKANSKWKDVEGYAANQTGHIDLQDHGGGVSFKNIKIREF
jgi:hypothetical protein